MKAIDILIDMDPEEHKNILYRLKIGQQVVVLPPNTEVVSDQPDSFDGTNGEGVTSLAKEGAITALVGDVKLLARLGVRLAQRDNIEIMRQGVDHAHGLARWRSAGGTVFELPDVWESISWVSIRGVLEDPFMYSLSRDGTQLIFDDAVPVDWPIVAQGEIRQV